MPDHDLPEQELQEWATLAQTITDADRVRHDPPAGLFDSILSNLDLADPDDQSASNESTRPAVEPPSEPVVVDFQAERQRRAPAAARQRRRQMFVASLAAAFLLVAGFSLFGSEETGENIAGETEFVAEATNSGLPESFGGSATATLLSGETWTLQIEFSDQLPDNEPVELWLINPDAGDMVSLGIVEPNSTAWDWPDGYPPDEYSLVDLSIEPDDGNPEHSGRSILRGQLQSV